MPENLNQNPNIQEATGQETDQRELGAKMLTVSGFRERRNVVTESGNQHNIVDTSYERAKSSGEKLIGQNNERKNDAYLQRLKRIIEKGGNRIERQLWKDSIKEDLLIKFENIPESYWDTKRQELRDNQMGGVELNDYLKKQYWEEARNLQQESLEKWVNYFSDENCPYPLWFKVYAWDGMTKMGNYSKAKANYEKRNETTVSPYPYPDAEVLAKTFDVVNQYFGNSQKEFFTDEGERNIPFEHIVSSGSFTKIFNAIQRDVAPILQPPENPEDVDGEWIEYGLGDEDDIARAARGTGWCVATPAVGRHYLTYGNYGNDDDGNDDWSDNEEESGLKSKFILFHLRDPETNKLSKSACASVRLDPDGKVAEISGTEKGQALTDSVVPTVEEKVKSLPGGEGFLKKFADKNALIEIDRKMGRGEDITYEEFRFIWELDRPIETLDTYNTSDPRINQFREKYGDDYAAERGYIIPSTTLEQIEGNLEKYVLGDINLDSDLLVYAMKKKARESIEEFEKMMSSEKINEKIVAQGGDEQIARMVERIRSLETYETDNYIFMLPKDRWKESIKLPECKEYSAIAPRDLTAILKRPVNYDYTYETDGRISGENIVYTDEWVGREIRHFPWSKELFKAEKDLLKPNGYSIPKSWRPIVESVEKEIGSDDDVDVSLALREKIGLAFSGYVWKGALNYVGYYGCFWSASEKSAHVAYYLSFDGGYVSPEGTYGLRCCGQSVRCVVSESGSF